MSSAGRVPDQPYCRWHQQTGTSLIIARNALEVWACASVLTPDRKHCARVSLRAHRRLQTAGLAVKFVKAHAAAGADSLASQVLNWGTSCCRLRLRGGNPFRHRQPPRVNPSTQQQPQRHHPPRVLDRCIRGCADGRSAAARASRHLDRSAVPSRRGTQLGAAHRRWPGKAWALCVFSQPAV